MVQKPDYMGRWVRLGQAAKLQLLTELSLDRKFEILRIPLPADDDDSVEAHRVRQLILSAADSTIHQTIKVEEGQLRKAEGTGLAALLDRIDAAIKARALK
jgi:hypothetical protein